MKLVHHPFIRSVEKTIHQFGMLQPGDTILVAVSGGPDSVALLHALTALRSKLNFQLAVAHLNHGLRPKTAASDAEFVAALCHKQGLRCHQKAIDLSTDQNNPHSSPEARARQARYDFFNTIARENSYTKIAVGHHANDNAELILMNLFRGSGSLGLAGIPPVRDQGIIRPLFHQTREQIQNFVETFKLECVQDETNRDIRFLRNRIRHELLPGLLRDYNPNLVDTLNRTADVLRAEQDFIRQSAQQAFDRMGVQRGPALHLSITSLQQLHLALQRRIIRLAIGKIKGDLKKVTFRHVDSVLHLCDQGLTGQRLSLPDGIVVQRNPQDALRLFKRPLLSKKTIDNREADALPLYKVPLPTTECRIQQNEIKALNITLTCQRVTAESVGDPGSSGQNTAFFDMDQLASPLDLRYVLPGDRFRPLGLMGTQKVKNFLINTKIPRDERRRILVLLNQDQIIWILGHRIDDRVKITQRSKNVLKIKISHQE